MESKNNYAFFKLLLYYILFSIMTLLITSFLISEARAANRFSRSETEYLINLFQDSDFDSTTLHNIFYDSRLKKMPVIVKRNVKNKEYQRNYNEFLSPYSIRLANRFARKWRTMLSRASSKFDVDREVLVAVLLVETGFGNVLGRYPIVSVYSSIVIENMKQKKCMLGQADGCLDDASRKRLSHKATWAEKELKALVEISQLLNRSLFHLKGSYAGAFGIPQFLPSSYLKWGYDSDQNGSVNLFLIPDAIYSIANYLKAHGWRKGLHHPSNRDVIWEYNHSSIYVDTIIKVARRVKVYPANPNINRTESDETGITMNLQRKQSNNPS